MDARRALVLLLVDLRVLPGKRTTLGSLHDDEELLVVGRIMMMKKKEKSISYSLQLSLALERES